MGVSSLILLRGKPGFHYPTTVFPPVGSSPSIIFILQIGGLYFNHCKSLMGPRTKYSVWFVLPPLPIKGYNFTDHFTCDIVFLLPPKMGVWSDSTSPSPWCIYVSFFRSSFRWHRSRTPLLVSLDTHCDFSMKKGSCTLRLRHLKDFSELKTSPTKRTFNVYTYVDFFMKKGWRKYHKYYECLCP